MKTYRITALVLVLLLASMMLMPAYASEGTGTDAGNTGDSDFSSYFEGLGNSGDETGDAGDSDFSSFFESMGDSDGETGDASDVGDSDFSSFFESLGDFGDESGDSDFSSFFENIDLGDSDSEMFSFGAVEIEGPYEIEETDFECLSHGLTLRGKLVVPVTDEMEKFPTVVLTHAFLGSYADMSDIAEALGKNGVASARFSLTGNTPSDGDYVDTTLTTQKEDILNVLAYVKTLDFVDTDNLFLCGKSQGGFNSAMAAVDCEDDINGIILWFPAICIPDDFNDGRVMYTPFDPENIPETLTIMGPYSVSREYIEEGMRIDPFTDFTVFQKDVLIIHGTDDFVVAYRYAQELAEAYPNATLLTIEGGSHGFMGSGQQLALEETVSFVLNHLK